MNIEYLNIEHFNNNSNIEHFSNGHIEIPYYAYTWGFSENITTAELNRRKLSTMGNVKQKCPKFPGGRSSSDDGKRDCSKAGGSNPGIYSTACHAWVFGYKGCPKHGHGPDPPPPPPPPGPPPPPPPPMPLSWYFPEGYDVERNKYRSDRMGRCFKPPVEKKICQRTSMDNTIAIPTPPPPPPPPAYRPPPPPPLPPASCTRPARKGTCGRNYAPVICPNGRTYNNECAASLAGCDNCPRTSR